LTRGCRRSPAPSARRWAVSAAELAPVVALRAPVPVEDELLRLRRAVELPRLIEAGYDPGGRVFRPAAEHPVFGYRLCPVAGCGSAVESTALCNACWRRFARFEGTVEQFAAIPRVFTHDGRAEQRLCLVCRTSGHERPAGARNGLCMACEWLRRERGQTVCEYVAGARPRPSFGRCGRCGRWAAFRDSRLCEPCQARWRAHGGPDLAMFAATRPRGARDASREVDLSALSERARLEVLYALQEIWLDGAYTWVGSRRLQSSIDAIAHAGAGSLLDELMIPGDYRNDLHRQLRVPVGRLLADPERELSLDVWRMGLLRPDGGRQRVDYRAVTQPWLRELVKQSNRQRLVSRTVGTLRSGVTAAVELSGVLALRADGGEVPSALGRQDVVDFLVHVRARERSGEITNQRHRECVTRLRTLLREARERGLHRPPGPAAGLSDQFVLYDADSPRAAMRDPEGEPERALPQVVIDQLLIAEAIALLRETVGEALACAIELQMRTGRRPQEIAHAPFGCLEHEQRLREDGKLEVLPVFVYRPEKRPKTRKELPIFAEERRLIRRMQALARERFPAADPGRLPLLPRQLANRDGRQPLDPHALAAKMRAWVRAVSELVGPDGEPFDRGKVFPYAFRHSYAQRLADQGASESELMDLMDHDSFETTRGYFRIRAERRRRAAELGNKALFDNRGRRLMRDLEHLAEAERSRMQMGSLAVPYGACVEPANVASMGGACKFMLKCIGCKHFRTDLSHLPALEAYERQLIAARERLSAEADVDGLEGWARQAAVPAQEEIDRVRYLIARIRETLGELAGEERAELEALLCAERTSRSAVLERLPARHELNVINAGATFDGAVG
ncbi:MAG: tyrosine-type recombinase/integrase, partial [Solirubrobacteraceae bacterium]